MSEKSRNHFARSFKCNLFNEVNDGKLSFGFVEEWRRSYETPGGRDNKGEQWRG